MLSSLTRTLFGNANDRLLKSFDPLLAAVNAREPEMKTLSDEALKAQTRKLRGLLKEGKTPDDILPEAFATVREAARRTLGMRHFDVQITGGIVLHKGMIAEMKTGEGKTLVATLAVYLNALEGKGVHVVTVNDYLARRDAEWMGKIYTFLGLNVGVIVHGVDDEQRQAAYAADVTYGTNNEFGFDYLRDNMKYALEQMVQRPFNFAIVDEVDSILIDEARTPLIISGPTEDNSELYARIDALIPKLKEEDYEKDEKAKTVTLTEEGVHRGEELLRQAKLLAEGTGLYDIDNVAVVHHVNQALKAHQMFTRDVDYIVKDNKVVIIDEFTGRMMEGRRYSEGLHQALEAKERVKIQNENQTLASITFQNYFRLYPKLAGMTGTAMTEASEFRDIYRLEVVEVLTHMPVKRADHDDEIYRTAREKYAAVISLIKECREREQPALVGTVSIEKSEYLSSLLKKEQIPHQVLNARYHEQEALIIAQAGRPGAVTIATNMAGRGTDIMLGGNPEMTLKPPPPPGGGADSATAESGGSVRVPRKEDPPRLASGSPAPPQGGSVHAEVAAAKEKVIAAGGLFVIGTERHESRRIDNQLRGRSGRQGDPGASKFFISFEDDLMRIFGGERMEAMTSKLGMAEGDAITHRWMTRAIEKAQQRVEARNYDIRKNLLKFDDVMNDQRKVIFEQRIELMETGDVSDTVASMRTEIAEDLVIRHIPKDSYAEQWDAEGLQKDLFRIYGLHLPSKAWAAEEGIADEEILTRITGAVETHMADKEGRFGAELMRMAEKRVLLTTLDQLWKDHLLSLDHLRHGINLRAYGQRDPLNEYKQEAFTLFEQLLYQLREAVTQRLSHLEVRVEAAHDMGSYKVTKKMRETRTDPALSGAAAPAAPVTVRVAPSARNPDDPSSWGRVGRNEACPCGSGRKYKHCHGKLV